MKGRKSPALELSRIEKEEENHTLILDSEEDEIPMLTGSMRTEVGHVIERAYERKLRLKTSLKKDKERKSSKKRRHHHSSHQRDTEKVYRIDTEEEREIRHERKRSL